MTVGGRQMAAEYDHLFRLLMVGESDVGKSQLLLCFADDIYTETYVRTIGVDFKIRTVESSCGKKIKLQIWDTAGQERFRNVSSSYYRGAHGIVLVYCITDHDSFVGIRQYLEEIERYADPYVHKILVGNNSDRASKRAVTFEMGQELADRNGMIFIETSPKDNLYVQEAFRLLTEDILSHVSSSSSCTSQIIRHRIRQLQQHRLHRLKVTWLLCRSSCASKGHANKLLCHLQALPSHLFAQIIAMLNIDMFPVPTRDEVDAFVQHSSGSQAEGGIAAPHRSSTCLPKELEGRQKASRSRRCQLQ